MDSQFIFKSIAFEPSKDGDPIDSSPHSIRRVQQALNRELGLQLPLDGVMGFRTRRAVRDFQRRNGLSADGLVGFDTIQRLFPNSNRGSEAVSQFDFDHETGFGQSLEYETLAGGITEKDYLRWAQFSMNMYFKKTGLRGPIVEDGKDTPEYRSAIELFNLKATSRKKYPKLDRKTQDRLIFENERNTGYLNWLRVQLDKLGFASLTAAYPAAKKPTKAIRAFQEKYDGKYGLSLKLEGSADGFVGPKTHLAILHAVKPPKKPAVKPTPPIKNDDLSDAQLENQLRKAEEYLTEHRLNSGKDVALLCLIRRLLKPVSDDRFIDARRMDQFFKDRPKPLKQYLYSGRRKLKVNLRTRWETGRSLTTKDFLSFVDGIRTDILQGMNIAFFQLTGADIYDRWRKSEVKREIGGLVQKSNSLYSCDFARTHYEDSIKKIP